MRDFLLMVSDKIISIGFFLLFFLAPLVLTPYNYELFEYNKMMATYGFTIIIFGAWLIKIISLKKINLRRTPLDIPLILFLISQIVSTYFSIDRHVSIWGYYSRFNGGLISTFCYLILYYAFVSNFPKDKIKKLLVVALTSGLLVSIYGILEHFGIDKNLWVQDVQNRVFSTLGQPNWLAAYLSILIPISIGFALNSKSQASNFKQNLNSKAQNRNPANFLKIDNWKLFEFWNLNFVILSSLFYLTLLFTKSRSGFLGLWISLIILLVLSVLCRYFHRRQSSHISHIHAIASICVIFVVITFFIGAPFDQINRFTLPEIRKNLATQTGRRPFDLAQDKQSTDNKKEEKPVGSSLLEVGITESGTIRKIVWKGAVDIFKNYPLFGSGVETFAFSYYKFRPVEHNMTSEWDFLYNKAHNEYLNFAATTGLFGLGSYLLIIVLFILWFIKIIKLQATNSKQYQNSNIQKNNLINILKIDNGNLFGIWNLEFGLFTAWLSILITNFFGFSVVVIQLYFYLIPAISFILMDKSENIHLITDNNKISQLRYFLIFVISLVVCYLLFVISRMWTADTYFAKGYSESQNQDYAKAYKNIRQAIILNSDEPLYYDEFVVPAGYLSVLMDENKDSTLSSRLRDEAILASNEAIKISPNNINFWKTRTRLFFMLGQIDEKYYDDAVDSLERSKFLSPTDPKITYNLGLLYDRKDTQQAIRMLEETIRLKPDYKDAYLALGLYYEKEKKFDLAKKEYNFILEHLDPGNADVLKRLEEIK